MRLSAVMISSTIPSTKYSCSGSPLMFWNGNTAIVACEATLVVQHGRRSHERQSGPARSFPVRHGRPGPGGRCFLAAAHRDHRSKVAPVADMVANRPRQADPAGFGQGLQASGYIYAVAVDVVRLDDDVAQVDPAAEYDPLVFRARGVALGHATLHRDRTGDRLYYAREFDQQTIARYFDDPALVLDDLRVDQFAAVGSEPCESAGFVLSHEAAVSGYIGGENGREPAFDPPFGQCSLRTGTLRLLRFSLLLRHSSINSLNAATVILIGWSVAKLRRKYRRKAAASERIVASRGA